MFVVVFRFPVFHLLDLIPHDPWEVMFVVVFRFPVFHLLDLIPHEVMFVVVFRFCPHHHELGKKTLFLPFLCFWAAA